MLVNRDTLISYGDDSEVTVLSWNSGELVLRVRIDVAGGEIWLIRISNVMHVDMPWNFMLGHAAFGGVELLPQDYLGSRNRGYEGDEDQYHVICFTDQDENAYFVIAYEPERFEKETT